MFRSFFGPSLTPGASTGFFIYFQKWYPRESKYYELIKRRQIMLENICFALFTCFFFLFFEYNNVIKLNLPEGIKKKSKQIMLG